MNQRFIAKIVTCFGVLAFMMLLSLSDAFAAPKSAAVATPAASGIVNLNTATQAELEKLPGIGPTMAKKIVAGRPYASVSDLSQKAGLPTGTVKKISPLVTVGATAKSSVTPAVKTSIQKPTVKSPVVPKTVVPDKVVAPPVGKGMVWVNPDSKVYHREASYWYGKTKKGSYMTEAEAVKAGYRAPKQGSRNQ
jgi:hypothetical protein